MERIRGWEEAFSPSGRFGGPHLEWALFRQEGEAIQVHPQGPRTALQTRTFSRH